jgi:hypothetical protein
MILTMLSLFQTLMKEKEVTKDIPTKATPIDHPEGAVDLEVARIASENLTTFDGLDVSESIPRESTDGADQVRETEV